MVKRYNSYSKKMFSGNAKPIRIIGSPDNQLPDKWSSTVFKLLFHLLFITGVTLGLAM
jgi:hypothetical protein